MSVPIAQDCRGRDGTSHTWCVSMLDASPVTSAEPGFLQPKVQVSLAEAGLAQSRSHHLPTALPPEEG